MNKRALIVIHAVFTGINIPGLVLSDLIATIGIWHQNAPVNIV